MLLVNYVNRLYLSEKHQTLERFIAIAEPRSQRISVVLTRLRFLAVAFDYHWDDFDVVEEVELSILVFEILDNSAIIDISFEIFDVVLDVFGFVGNWKIESIVSQPKAQHVHSVAHPNILMLMRLRLPQKVVLSSGVKRHSAWRLNYTSDTLGKLIIPTILHLYPSEICLIS